MSKRIAVGIDLGTTFSCIGVFRNDRVDIIANDIGQRTTPSYVGFDDTEVHIGQAAKDQGNVNPKNTVFEAKRLIGRKFKDASVQEDIKLWPFEVFDDGRAPKIRVQFKMKEKIVTPEQISALLLSKLKEAAETYIGSEVEDAVITVPAYFNDSQRQATLDAGSIAGLNVLKILNEPTAAAIAYGFDKKVDGVQKILVYDLGGGTFDVALLTISGSKYEVKAVGGDSHLGGGDFDTRLVVHFIEIIKQKYDESLADNPRALKRLRKACEAAKIRLSGSSKANIDIPALFGGKDFRESITRAKFETLCVDLFEETIGHVHNVLEDAFVKTTDIDEVILVGGSSRIPKIQELLKDYFGGKKLNSTINPDEAVAYGAVLHATKTVEELTLVDVIPKSLGLRNHIGEMKTFIKRNSQIPKKVVDDSWTTTKDNITQCNICVYEGERTMTLHNNFLGSFLFDIGEEVEAGVPKLAFTFEVDANGILHVTGENIRNASKAGVSITSNKGRLEKEEIERLVQETKDMHLIE